MSEILYIRLISGDQIVARYVADAEGMLTIDYPMLVENRNHEGESAINLVKYLPFTNHNEQTMILNKLHIVTLTTVSTEFAKYFLNNWQYAETYVAPRTQANMSQINRSLESALSGDTQDFAAAMDKYANQMPNVLSNKVH